MDVIEELDNPFAEDSDDMLELDTKDIATPAVTHTVRHVQELSQKQYDQYVQNRLLTRTNSISDVANT